MILLKSIIWVINLYSIKCKYNYYPKKGLSIHQQYLKIYIPKIEEC